MLNLQLLEENLDKALAEETKFSLIKWLKSKRKTKVFEALYNPCIHESGFITLSLHKTKEGAQKAIDSHREKEKLEFEKMVNAPNQEFPELWENMKYDDHCDWIIGESELLD